MQDYPDSKPRKVLILVENLSVPFDRRVWRECNALREAGYQVSVICPRGKNTDTESHAVINGVSIYRYGLYQSTGGVASYLVEYGISLLMTFLLTPVVLLREGFDVIQVCNPPDLFILAAMPYRLLGKKIIFDQHDLSPEIYEAQKGDVKGSMVYKALLFFEHMTYRLSDAVIATNDSFKEVARERGGKKDSDIFIVRNAPSRENIEKAVAVSELRSKATYLLSYIGVMGPQDGIDILLRAVRCLSGDHKRSDFHVLLMGAGTVYEEMKQYAKDLGVDHLVTFTGYVDYDMVMNGIASADVCVCPDPLTPMNDKSTLVKIIEYMSVGRPIVAFDLRETRKSAADAAVYARPNDENDFAEQIHRLLESPELRATMGRIGRERVETMLSWEHSKEALYAAYDHVFAMKNGTIGEIAK